MRLKLFFLLLLGISASIPVRAQTCCTGAAALAGNTVLTNPGEGQLFFSLLYDFNNLDYLILENEVVSGNNLERKTSTFLVQGSYGFSKSFGLSVSIPVVYLSQTASGSQDRIDNTGLSDIIISPQITPVNSQLSQLQFGIGLKLPTGSTSRTIEDSDIIMTPSLQAGTGSVDIILHTLYNQSFKFRRSLNLQGLLSYRINTVSKGLGGHDTYQFGNELFSQLTFSDQFVVERSILNPSLGLIYRITGMNRIEGFEDVNSGGKWLYIRPGIGYIVNKVTISLYSELPLWWNLNGFQLTTSYRIIASFGLNIN